MNPELLPAHALRGRFCTALSDLYRAEVPLYGELLDLVTKVNAGGADAGSPSLQVERHGAIRLGTAAELRTMRRVLAVLGLFPVSYYDLSVAGVPVHSTAFRPVDPYDLQRHPFRLFTSLLRLELIGDVQLRAEAEAILAKRRIFSCELLALTARHEERGGLTEAEAERFLQSALDAFRWHTDAPVTAAQYRALNAAHRLIADVVCFHGPHINHLTPRTLDIDAAQVAMRQRGMRAKDRIEGPPPRRNPILLRQTSFVALDEPIVFSDGVAGTHTARFGEIEQRGIALTRKGRALYDQLLAQARGGDDDALQAAFAAFPDDLDTLRREGLAFFEYRRVPAAAASGGDLEARIARGEIEAKPLRYEDFLPVSAAGIFRSNLGYGARDGYGAQSAQRAFEQALGCPVLDEFALYERQQRESLEAIELTAEVLA